MPVLDSDDDRLERAVGALTVLSGVDVDTARATIRSTAAGHAVTTHVVAQQILHLAHPPSAPSPQMSTGLGNELWQLCRDYPGIDPEVCRDARAWSWITHPSTPRPSPHDRN